MKINLARFTKHTIAYLLLGMLTTFIAGMLIEAGVHGFIIAIVLAVGWGATPAAITEALINQYKK